MASCRLMRTRLRTALTLSRRDWWLVLQAWALLLIVDRGLRTLSFGRVQQLLSLPPKDMAHVQAHPSWEEIQTVARLVDTAARHHLQPMRCLPRSLVTQWLLVRRGIRTNLRFGVQRDGAGLKGHAWLEHGGCAIGESLHLEERFVPLVAQGAKP